MQPKKRRPDQHTTKYSAETLKEIQLKSQANMVWQSLGELQAYLSGRNPRLNGLTKRVRKALIYEGILKYTTGLPPYWHITPLGKALIAQEETLNKTSPKLVGLA